MEAAIFKKLLTDLYGVYNPGKTADIDRMVSQNSGREFDAIKTIYLKYNFKQSPYYDPKLGTDKQISDLIQKYNSGNTVLIEEKIEEPVVEEKAVHVENKMPFLINLKFNFDGSDLIVPDLYNFLFVSINQRIILKTKSGGLIGVEVIDILDDYVSNPDEPSREIILEKK